ncbi:hypothetical protein [Caulobacter sp. NIBR2454]|uniref:hypothetical protein n=1 Tax=Caulobacter sp. NIBR2454 TaxID=3015996 RepID=UPI0022B6EA16|nr:hypothetical protein [Caulobacter sp. NIBR2454]
MIGLLLAASVAALSPVQAVSAIDAAKPAVSITEPREAIVAPCLAKAPVIGQAFSGPVLQVIDAQTLCVAQGMDPSEWVLVRLPRHQRAHTRGDLLAASFARNVTCLAMRRADEGVVASCKVEGADVGHLTRTTALKSQGLAWR